LLLASTSSSLANKSAFLVGSKPTEDLLFIAFVVVVGVAAADVAVIVVATEADLSLRRGFWGLLRFVTVTNLPIFPVLTLP